MADSVERRATEVVDEVAAISAVSKALKDLPPPAAERVAFDRFTANPNVWTALCETLLEEVEGMRQQARVLESRRALEAGERVE